LRSCFQRTSSEILGLGCDLLVRVRCKCYTDFGSGSGMRMRMRILYNPRQILRLQGSRHLCARGTGVPPNPFTMQTFSFRLLTKLSLFMLMLLSLHQHCCVLSPPGIAVVCGRVDCGAISKYAKGRKLIIIGRHTDSGNRPMDCCVINSLTFGKKLD
jgi:hypothetical protein